MTLTTFIPTVRLACFYASFNSLFRRGRVLTHPLGTPVHTSLFFTFVCSTHVQYTGWDYRNNSCRAVPNQMAFRKIGTDSYFVGTYFQESTFEICNDADTSTECQASGQKIVPPGVTNYFNSNADVSELYIDLRAIAKDVSFDSMDPVNEEMEYIVHSPDGKETTVDSKYRRGGLKLRVPVPDLLSMSAVEGNLNGVNMAASTVTSFGKPRHRIIGLKVYMRVELRNQWEKLTWPPEGKIFGRFSCHLFLTYELDWMRLPSAITVPTRKQGEMRIVDTYGIRLTIHDNVHGMRRFSAVRFLQASTNLIVLWLSVRFLVTFFVKWCLGISSRKWRRAASRNIETHVLVNRHSQNRIRRRHNIEARARDIVIALARHLATDARSSAVEAVTTPEAGRDKYTKKEQELMFAQLDSDADGKVTEDELMNYMRKKGFSSISWQSTP